MRSYEKDEEIVVNQKLTSISCNKCGTNSSYAMNGEQLHDMEEFQEFNTSFGYGSRYDMERWSFDLCDDCLTELIKSFRIAPNGFGEDSYYAVYPQAMFNKWKETGEVDLEAGMTKEEITERCGSIYMSEEESKEEYKRLYGEEDNK